MRFRNGLPASLIAMFAAFIPSGTIAAGAAPSGLNISAEDGSSAVHVWGTVTGTRQLQAVLYAKFSPDLPTVLLTRRPIGADANGTVDATIPFAPADFTGAIITVIVQTPAGVPVGRGSIVLGAPIVPASSTTPSSTSTR
jgi:hypothetical protein